MAVRKGREAREKVQGYSARLACKTKRLEPLIPQIFGIECRRKLGEQRENQQRKKQFVLNWSKLESCTQSWEAWKEDRKPEKRPKSPALQDPLRKVFQAPPGPSEEGLPGPMPALHQKAICRLDQTAIYFPTRGNRSDYRGIYF